MKEILPIILKWDPMSKENPFHLFELPCPEFISRFRDVCLLTGCFPIGPLPEVDDVAAWEKHRQEQKILYRYKVSFEAGSKIAGIETFLYLHKSVYSFPAWLTSWISDALHEFNRTEGKSRDLTKLLKMEARQKKGNEYQAEKAKNRAGLIYYDMMFLQALTNSGVTKCAEVLSFSMPEGQPLSARRIENIFIETKKLREDEFNEIQKDVLSHLEETFLDYNQFMQAAAEDPTCSFSFDDLRRPLARLIEEVEEFPSDMNSSPFKKKY